MEKGIVKNLFIKRESKLPLDAVQELIIHEGVISGQKRFQKMRDVLISSSELANLWNINPGDFRENIFFG